MMQKLTLAVLPVVAAVITFGQSPVASAATQPVADSPHATFLVQPSAHLTESRGSDVRCLVCPHASISATWGGGVFPSEGSLTTITVSGQHLTPGSRVEITIPGGPLFGDWINLLDTVVTAASDGPCRASRDCANPPGSFDVVSDLSYWFARGQVHCGDQLSVTAIDLTPRQPHAPILADTIQTIACDVTPVTQR